MSAWTRLMRMVALAAVLAAPLAAAPAASAADPEKFKDWELFCPEPKPKDKPRVCEVRTIIIGKQGGRLGALAVALSPEPGAPDVPMIATALLPLGVDLALAPALKVGDGKPLLLRFQRCLQRGCEAVTAIDADYLQTLRGGTTARVAVGIGGGKTAVFEFSLAGFGAALDALKQRAGKS